jgi:hypothetical protein
MQMSVSILRQSLLGANFALAALCAAPVFAQDMAAPTGDVILTVSGNIAASNGNDVLALDAELFAALPQHSFTTGTIWTKGTATYTGVLLRDLLAAVGAKGDTVMLTALNDYLIEMPASDALENGPLLANLSDGQPMSLRDKGPIWLVYPYDDVAEYRSEQTYARSIWQLNRIEVAD